MLFTFKKSLFERYASTCSLWPTWKQLRYFVLFFKLCAYIALFTGRESYKSKKKKRPQQKTDFNPQVVCFCRGRFHVCLVLTLSATMQFVLWIYFTSVSRRIRPRRLPSRLKHRQFFMQLTNLLVSFVYPWWRVTGTALWFKQFKIIFSSVLLHNYIASAFWTADFAYTGSVKKCCHKICAVHAKKHRIIVCT